MPTTAEMVRTLKKIRSYCRTYEGPNAEFFELLYEEVRTIPSRDEELDARIGDLYIRAIAALVSRSAPPSKDTFLHVLERFRRITGSEIVGIEIVITDPIESSTQVRRHPRSKQSGSLVDLLPRARRLSGAQRELLANFGRHLPASDVMVGSAGVRDRS